MRSADGSITRLGDRHYRIRVTAGYDPDTGKQVRASRTIRGSRRDAEEIKDRLKREYGCADAVVYGRMSVYDFVRDEWMATRKLRETTRRGYEATLANHIAPAFEHVRMREVSMLHITRALNAIERPGAALNAYKMLRSAFNLAVRAGVMTTSPVSRVDPPTLADYEAEVYSLSEVVAILEYWRGHECEAGIIVAACCGTRASETCGLDWTDLSLVPGDGGPEIRSRGAVEVYEGYHSDRTMTPTKTKRSNRVVALPAFAVDRLLEIRGDGRIGPLVVDADGERMTPGGLSHRWRKMMLPRVDATGEVTYAPPVRYIPLKNLRHSRATILLDLGAPMHDVSLSLGHVNERTTDAFYNRPERRADHGNAERLDRALADIRSRHDSEASARS